MQKSCARTGVNCGERVKKFFPKVVPAGRVTCAPEIPALYTVFRGTGKTSRTSRRDSATMQLDFLDILGVDERADVVEFLLERVR